MYIGAIQKRPSATAARLTHTQRKWIGGRWIGGANQKKKKCKNYQQLELCAAFGDARLAKQQQVQHDDGPRAGSGHRGSLIYTSIFYYCVYIIMLLYIESIHTLTLQTLAQHTRGSVVFNEGSMS